MISRQAAGMAISLVPLTPQVMVVPAGLPLHPLVVHAATVLLPLSLLGLVVAVALPRFRSRVAGLAVLGLAAGAVAAWIAEETGESLADQVGVAQTHARYGEWVPVVAVLALIVGTLWWRLQRGPSIPNLPSWSTRAAGIAVVAVAVLTVGLTVLAGHSGAASVWESKDPSAAGLATSATPSAAAGGNSNGGNTAGGNPADGNPAGGNPTGAPSNGGPGGLTMAEVAKHNSRTSCWSVVAGKVYDLTSWVSQHPGGPGTIAGMCGVDATAAFRGKHSSAPGPAKALAGLALGALSAGGPEVATATAAPGPPPAPTTRYSRAEVAKHASTSDCWSVVNGKVYDLTKWVSRHPGGREGIAEMCGINGAGEFLEQHARDAAAQEVLAGYQIGVLG